VQAFSGRIFIGMDKHPCRAFLVLKRGCVGLPLPLVFGPAGPLSRTSTSGRIYRFFANNSFGSFFEEVTHISVGAAFNDSFSRFIRIFTYAEAEFFGRHSQGYAV